MDIYTRRIPEDRLDGRRLGRHVKHDPRSREYRAELADQVASVVHKAVGLPLDQDKPKPLGSCTANALCVARNSAPNNSDGKVLTETDAIKLYELETKNEGEPYPPNDPGGTGLEVCKAAKQLGLITSYNHAFGIDEALRALVVRPVIFGVAWYDGFDTPDPDGIVKISGSIRGGHEIVALRIIAEHELVGFAQSWGLGWGVPDPEMGLPDGGAFYVPFDDLDRLLKDQGDATVPIV